MAVGAISRDRFLENATSRCHLEQPLGRNRTPLYDIPPRLASPRPPSDLSPSELAPPHFFSSLSAFPTPLLPLALCFCFLFAHTRLFSLGPDLLRQAVNGLAAVHQDLVAEARGAGEGRGGEGEEDDTQPSLTPPQPLVPGLPVKFEDVHHHTSAGRPFPTLDANACVEERGFFGQTLGPDCELGEVAVSDAAANKTHPDSPLVSLTCEGGGQGRWAGQQGRHAMRSQGVAPPNCCLPADLKRLAAVELSFPTGRRGVSVRAGWVRRGASARAAWGQCEGGVGAAWCQ